jgi:hypothetical protein
MSQLMSVMIPNYICFTQVYFNSDSIKEELLKTIPLHRKPKGENAFQSFYTSLLEMIVPIHKLVYIATDGPLSRTHIVTSVSLFSKVFV